MPRNACKAVTNGASCHDGIRLDLLSKTLNPLKELLDRMHIFLQDNLLRTVRHLDACDPVPMSQAPIGTAAVPITVSK
jgi:hypothetical protein